MSEPQRIHLHYCELSGTSELRLTDTGEFIYYDDHLKEIQRLQAEIARIKAIADKEANTAIAILNHSDDKTVQDMAAHIADQLISITDVPDL